MAEPGAPVLRVLVTGATGFMGAAAVQALGDAGYAVRATWHRRPPPAGAAVEWRREDLTGAGDEELCTGVDTVLHLAARAHVTGVARWLPAPFQRVNAAATARLADRARRAGVRRFIYLSTIGVHGRASVIVNGAARPLRAEDPVAPADAYARSKAAGEAALSGAGMETVILRAPLVFGPGVAGNFLRLVRHLDRGLPLPVGPLPALRSLVYVQNLAADLAACVTAPAVAGRTFLLADYDVTVTDLAQRLADLLQRPLRTVALPAWLLRGRALAALTAPLRVDGAPFRAAVPRNRTMDLDTALARTVAAYRAHP